MILSTALQSVPIGFRGLFHVEELDMDSGVSILVRFRTPTTKRFITATSHPHVTRQKAAKLAKKSDGIKYLTTSIKTVKKSWESGNPISRHEIYVRMIQQFGSMEEGAAQSEFCTVMKLNDGGISPALAQWVCRRLEGANWSIRKESIYQVSPRDTEFVVPTGNKRVGSNVASDAKKGCTEMVSAEMYSSMILPPFVVMTATHNGTLARRFSTWRQDGGDASVNFQPSHWMDIPTAKKYVDFLVSLFPGQKIGLMWDAASAHTCQEVIDYLDAKGLMHEFIPVGLTPIMQIGELYANRPLKVAIKKKFLQWKVSQTIPAGGKYKVDRVQMIHWIEEAVSMVNEQQTSARKPDNQLFQEHMGQLQDNEVYSSLILNQTAESLE
ncbi:hypothetical protein PHYSODRAFT_515394 [Phytophthora sojae]|uniref:DDE-1 domain-containing protein n=1 Tax=Phytophthora sojae (strain P6497) TaxID=1094619 RepID=G4ZY39_PHYSP|nr:hypothetical protein PHYSODRAFT_515394 [Phytophthora sojae]EGZ11945.1 hypothetical protein PHYSODRAFT_515394 [Phytophthora sojae]|eukprot:XP_009532278.1 hypothetical protein PHYSODRAFT_515394 [Phytophthora sojae]